MAGVRQKAEQLEQLLAAGVDPGAVDAELAGLADLAASLDSAVSLPTPAPAFREALRTQLLTAPVPTPAPVPTHVGATEKVRRFVEQHVGDVAASGKAAVAAAAGAAVVATGGAFGVAQQALPGDLLYPVKDATEDLRLAFASGDVERGQLHLQFAQERISELEAGIDRLSADLIAQTLDRLDDSVVDAANDLLNAFAQTADEALLAELRAFTTDAGTRLTALADRVPAEVAGRLDDSVEVLRRVEIQIDVATGQVDCDCEPATTLATNRDSFVTRPGEGPAVPAQPCDCTPGSSTPRPAPAPQDPAAPAPQPQPEPAPAPEPPVADEDPETVPRLPGPLDPAGDLVEDVVDDLIDQLPIDPVETVPEPVRTPVQDTRRQVNETVGDVSQQIDDLLP